MSDKIHGFLPATAETPNNRQRLFVRYTLGVLIDLVVLGLFAEFWDLVSVDSFSIALLAAVLLQLMLKLTIALEHQVAVFFKARAGGFMTFMRFFGAWLVLFGSKFAILEVITLAFGDKVRFDGPFHGVVALIAVVVVMIVAEEVPVRIYRRMA
ncbi:hypothetical protein OKA05_27745 [Luteolibacter arcticus]|uniref:Uncharacterized protein n=1 Tax=Luteolibacter arcticus TaxID=1581411 RepID=A0ABT3GS63_9BACT|nr:hypothetical protein [Luteolibacter arcticus]MCW1926376.1 hypothetical protein [Luteolibacter arcticus]